MSFVSLKYDYVFREVFSNEDVLKHFISDVTGIRRDGIRSVRLTTPYLRKRYQKQKQGILDIALVMNDDTKIDIELQVRPQKYWIKRNLFYLAKMYTGDLGIGQKYERLRKCITICILDFNLLPEAKCHSTYQLRNSEGKELTDLFEVHIIELRKEGSEDMEKEDTLSDWIRLMNAESMEELDMIKTKNTGVMEAVKMVKTMNLGKNLRLMYETHLKAVRDRWAEDEYVRDEGRAEGLAKGKVESKTEWLLQMLEEFGEIPDSLRDRVLAEKEPEMLDAWFAAARKAKSLQEFRETTGI